MMIPKTSLLQGGSESHEVYDFSFLLFKILYLIRQQNCRSDALTMIRIQKGRGYGKARV